MPQHHDEGLGGQIHQDQVLRVIDAQQHVLPAHLAEERLAPGRAEQAHQIDGKPAWVLGALVAVAYAVCYILLQMETYALVAGTLVLFVILVGIMYFTRDLRPALGGSPAEDVPTNN